VIFMVIRAINSHKRKQEEVVLPPPPSPSKEEVLLSDMRDILQEKRYAFELKLLGFQSKT